jgi:hypothetical protein
MNWEQHSFFSVSFNELMSTACSPNRACGKLVNNSNQPVKSSSSRFAHANYSPLFRVKKVCGEQVLLDAFQKNLRLSRPAGRLTIASDLSLGQARQFIKSRQGRQKISWLVCLSSLTGLGVARLPATHG